MTPTAFSPTALLGPQGESEKYFDTSINMEKSPLKAWGHKGHSPAAVILWSLPGPISALKI